MSSSPRTPAAVAGCGEGACCTVGPVFEALPAARLTMGSAWALPEACAMAVARMEEVPPVMPTRELELVLPSPLFCCRSSFLNSDTSSWCATPALRPEPEPSPVSVETRGVRCWLKRSDMMLMHSLPSSSPSSPAPSTLPSICEVTSPGSSYSLSSHAWMPLLAMSMSMSDCPTSSSNACPICAPICALKFTGCSRSDAPMAIRSRTSSASLGVTSCPSRILFSSLMALSAGVSMSMMVANVLSRAASTSTRVALSLAFISCACAFSSSSLARVQCRSWFSACSSTTWCSVCTALVTSSCATMYTCCSVMGSLALDTCTWCHVSLASFCPSMSHLCSTGDLILMTLLNMLLASVTARISSRASASW
mmetsp:Transcript_16748/g.41928  ORF Transcript_16748/g.41928 Transcript_16748/m.41928 type:complete len:366 (-) Transcript_16748:944-2041(-)